MKKKAIVVLSGGLDSSTCLGIALDRGFDVYPITFFYGQRHKKEIEQAKKIVDFYNIKNHKIINVNFLSQIGGSALTDEKLEIPTDGVNNDIPNTYVPGRNMIFLSLAAAYAEVINATHIFTGVTAVDYSGYPDCTPPFIESMNKTINLATKAGINNKNLVISTPLISLSKDEIIKWGLDLGVPYHLTTSCYKGNERACGLCDSCRMRIEGFKKNNKVDPIDYDIKINWEVKLSEI